MNKNKYILGIVICLLALSGVAGGYFISKRSNQKVSFGAASIDGAAQVASATDQTTTQSSSSLNIANSPAATNLGQLSGNTLGAAGTGQSSAPASANNASSSQQAINPATFSEYEKYKDSQSPLYGDIVKGSGAEIAVNQKAAVYYKGWLTNGQMFDQSRAGSDGKLEPFVFTQGAHQVITGWEQGVVGMKVGGKRLIIVPPALGYGANGQGSIPANSVLVFEVELLAVQ